MQKRQQILVYIVWKGFVHEILSSAEPQSSILPVTVNTKDHVTMNVIMWHAAETNRKSIQAWIVVG